jgi:hypothetical protein
MGRDGVLHVMAQDKTRLKGKVRAQKEVQTKKLEMMSVNPLPEDVIAKMLNGVLCPTFMI